MSKHIHLIRIDKVCSKCNYRNQGEYKLDEPMEIICCGNCGTILSKPDDMSKIEQEKVSLCVKQALEDEEE